MTKNEIIKHYKDFFDLHAKGIALDEDDHLNIDWAMQLVKDIILLYDNNNQPDCSDKQPYQCDEVKGCFECPEYKDKVSINAATVCPKCGSSLNTSCQFL